jgi:hypothetical protein
MLNGEAEFNKIYPREVSRKLNKLKLVLVIYPSSLGNNLSSKKNAVQCEEIEPIILYGLRVITKQQSKVDKSKNEQMSSEC